MSTNIPEGLIVSDGYGGKTIKGDSADYFWGDKAKPIKVPWKAKAKIPQLETLIELFKGVETLIAGGAILASYDAVEYGDIDVFPLNIKAVKQTTDILSNLGYKETKTEDHMLLFERKESSFRPVQVILLHTDVKSDPQRVLNRFDISVCQVGVYNKAFVSNDIAIKDIQVKVLRALRTMNVHSLLARIVKYNKRGYGVIDGMTNEEAQKLANTKTNTAG